MRVKAAYKLLKTKVSDIKVMGCVEYESVFVFDAWPNTFKPSRPGQIPFDSLYSVDKKTGEILIFQPFNIPIEEYKKGRRIF